MSLQLNDAALAITTLLGDEIYQAWETPRPWENKKISREILFIVSGALLQM